MSTLFGFSYISIIVSWLKSNNIKKYVYIAFLYQFVFLFLIFMLCYTDHPSLYPSQLYFSLPKIWDQSGKFRRFPLESLQPQAMVKTKSTCWVIRLGEVAAKEKSIPNLYYTVDGRNPKQPPGMVFQSWWLAGFWDPSTVCRKNGWPYRSERNKASAMAKVHVKQTLTSSLESFWLVGSTVHWPPGLIKTLICCISKLWKMFGTLPKVFLYRNAHPLHQNVCKNHRRFVTSYHFQKNKSWPSRRFETKLPSRTSRDSRLLLQITLPSLQWRQASGWSDFQQHLTHPGYFPPWN